MFIHLTPADFRFVSHLQQHNTTEQMWISPKDLDRRLKDRKIPRPSRVSWTNSLSTCQTESRGNGTLYFNPLPAALPSDWLLYRIHMTCFSQHRCDAFRLLPQRSTNPKCVCYAVLQVLTFSASLVSSNSLFCRRAGVAFAVSHASAHMLPGIFIRTLRSPRTTVCPFSSVTSSST